MLLLVFTGVFKARSCILTHDEPQDSKKVTATQENNDLLHDLVNVRNSDHLLNVIVVVLLALGQLRILNDYFAHPLHKEELHLSHEGLLVENFYPIQDAQNLD